MTPFPSSLQGRRLPFMVEYPSEARSTLLDRYPLVGHCSPFTAFMSEHPTSGDHDFPAPGHPLPPAGSGPSQSSRDSGPSSVMGEYRLWPEAGTLRDPAKQGLGPPRPQSLPFPRHAVTIVTVVYALSTGFGTADYVIRATV